MEPCKHLDHTEGKYEDCELMTGSPRYPNVRYWLRGARWTVNENGTTNPAKVQFCKLRGRINGIFQCYNEGEMHCYEPEANRGTT